jgi:hypothetical protein
MHLSDDDLCGMGEAHPLGRDGEADQQFGRTRQRDRAGSTGRAGCSRAGEQLVCLFFIDALLVCGSMMHARHEHRGLTPYFHSNQTVLSCQRPPCGMGQLGDERMLMAQHTPPPQDNDCCTVVLPRTMVHADRQREVDITRALMRDSVWIRAHPDESAQLLVEGKHVTASLEDNR